MPTGYTAAIHDGKDITFPDFAMQCARAFGALIEMRDEPADAPIPDEFTPEPYYQQHLDRARTQLAELEGRTDEQWASAAQRDYEEAVRSAAASNARYLAMRERYEAMLTQVDAWEPPTPDHEELKRFMAKQISDSIDFDCHAVEAPERIGGEVYKAQRIAEAQRSVSYYERETAKGAERAQGRTEWLRALRASLPETSRA